MRDLLGIMEHTMQLLYVGNSLEESCDSAFRYLRTLMPLKLLLLGFFDQPQQKAFILAWTTQAGTRRMFRAYPFTEQHKKLMDAYDFFRNPEDIFVQSPVHPLADLFRNPDLALEPPFYSSRFYHDNVQQGAGTFMFDKDKPLPADALDILRVLKLPFNVFITSQHRYWELGQVNRMMSEDNARLRKQAMGLEQTDIIGASGGLKDVVDKLRQVAPLDVTLLIQGETGTGKEVLAKAAHELSLRRKGPFVAVNCGAIPPSLIDNELFGHKKGSFTGATELYRGRFERASGGTLFLDEVGELPLEVQARLLRVLEERAIERLGGNETIPVDFRLIAATHRDLKHMVADGRFREDLYYRLAVVSLRLPPLRGRKQDIPLLARHFVDQCSSRFGMLPPDIPPAEIARLCAYDWPGNVRELQNVVEEAVALGLSGGLRFQTEPGQMPQALSRPDPDPARFLPYDAMVKTHLEDALDRCEGKIQGRHSAAELLDMHPNTLRTKLEKYGIAYGRQRKNTAPQ